MNIYSKNDATGLPRGAKTTEGAQTLMARSLHVQGVTARTEDGEGAALSW